MIALDVTTLPARVGQEVAVSDWLEITESLITQFAEATGDTQWIHVDSARAAVESPFETTVAHGFLTLSLVSTLAQSTITLAPFTTTINYGLNRVRFVSPVPAGSRIRARMTPMSVEELQGGGVQLVWHITIEREGQERPSAVIEWIVRYLR